MIKKIVFSALMCMFVVCVFGQIEPLYKNELQISLNRSFLTAGDVPGVHFKNSYYRSAFKWLKLGAAFGIVHSSTNSDAFLTDVSEEYKETNIKTGDWRLTKEEGLKILDLHTNQQTYIHFDICAKYTLVNENWLKINVFGGASISYISKTYITGWELGVFNGAVSGEQNIQLFSPYYTRLIDIGLCGGIDVVYHLSDRVDVGAVAGFNNYNISGYRFYDLGIKGGVKI